MNEQEKKDFELWRKVLHHFNLWLYAPKGWRKYYRLDGLVNIQIGKTWPQARSNIYDAIVEHVKARHEWEKKQEVAA